LREVCEILKSRQKEWQFRNPAKDILWSRRARVQYFFFPFPNALSPIEAVAPPF